MSSGPKPGRVVIYDHQSHAAMDQEKLAQYATAALAQLLTKGALKPELADNAEIEINLVDDAEIGRVHGEFLQDATPTDVITFQHGEILVSVETADREARVRGISLLEEVARYMIHGLLHLAGYDDQHPSARAAMHAEQERLLAGVLACR